METKVWQFDVLYFFKHVNFYQDSSLILCLDLGMDYHKKMIIKDMS